MKVYYDIAVIRGILRMYNFPFSFRMLSEIRCIGLDKHTLKIYYSDCTDEEFDITDFDVTFSFRGDAPLCLG